MQAKIDENGLFNYEIKTTIKLHPAIPSEANIDMMFSILKSKLLKQFKEDLKEYNDKDK